MSSALQPESGWGEEMLTLNTELQQLRTPGWEHIITPQLHIESLLHLRITVRGLP